MFLEIFKGRIAVYLIYQAQSSLSSTIYTKLDELTLEHRARDAVSRTSSLELQDGVEKLAEQPTYCTAFCSFGWYA